MSDIILPALLRYLHIVSAVVAVGGIAFMTLALAPGMRLLEDSLRQSVMMLIQQRFARVVWASVAVLVVTGVFNWVSLAPTYRDMGPAGNALIGTKVLVAVLLFAVIWAQGAGFGASRSPRFWLMLKLHLAALVILLASILRTCRLEHLMSPAGW